MQISGCGATSAILTLNGDMGNAGEVDLANPGDACGGTAQVVVPPGSTLTNDGTIATFPNRGDRQLTGNVTNNGTVSFNSPVAHLDGAGLFDNHGGVTIVDGLSLIIPDGAGYEFRNDSGGSVAGGGSGQLVVRSGNTFEEGDGITSGNSILLTGGSTLHFSGSGPSSFVLEGTNTIGGNAIAAGQAVYLDITGCSPVNAVANLAGSM